MFFGNSRISIKNKITELCSQFETNNYIITFIDESSSGTSYTDTYGELVRQPWIDDKNAWETEMDGPACSYLIFDIETTEYGDYIWPENSSPVNYPPMSLENIIKTFRPSSGNQLEFYNLVLSGIQSRWGSGIWEEMSQQGKKLIIFVDNSGSMTTSLIQDALNYLTTYATERGVSVTVKENCENERWVAWGINGYYDGSDAGCTGACQNGKRCVYTCFAPCQRTSVVCVGPNEDCPNIDCNDLICSEGNNPPSTIQNCTLCGLLEENPCNLGACDRCDENTQQNEIYKCVECYYLETLVGPSPSPTGSPLCVTASYEITSGTTFGSPTWNSGGEVWEFDPTSGTGSYPISGQSPCPQTYPGDTEGLVTFWYGVYCGCTSCGPGEICSYSGC